MEESDLKISGISYGYDEVDINQPSEDKKEGLGETDFYVIIDYKKVRGVIVKEMEDGDGDFDDCLVIPMLKNGIKSWGRDKWRVILAARKSHRDENASHVLVPQVEEKVQKGMVACGYSMMYEHIAPIIGDVVPDITKIPRPPIFSERSLAYKEMEMHRTDNPKGGSTAVSFTKEQDFVVRKEQKYLSEAQKRMREAILKNKNR